MVFGENGWAIHETLTAISLIENNTMIQDNTDWVCDRSGLERSAAIVLYQWSVGGSSDIRFNSIEGFCWGISPEGAIATIEGGWINNTARGIGLARRGDDTVETDFAIESNHIYGTSQYGIISTASSKLTIGNSSVTDSSVGIHILHSSTASIYQCSFSDNGLGVKTYPKTSTQISNSVFVGNGEGFHSEGQDRISLSEFLSNDEGIRVQGNPSSGYREISNNTITNSNVRAGIWILSSTSSDIIQNNEISGNYRGVWITGGSSYKNIRWNSLKDNGFAVKLEPSSGVAPSYNDVKDNNISMNEYGIHVYSSNNNFLENNNISGNRNSGIYLDSVYSVTLRYSNITNNFMGIVIKEDEPPPQWSVTINENSILGNTLWAINSSLSEILDVRDNFFGAWNNDTIDEMISGNVIFYPWLGFRESNVDIIDFLELISPMFSPYYVERGKIVNGSLVVGMNVEVIFNNSLGQNFIQINGVMNALADSTFSSNYGNFTVIYLNGSQGSISQSTFEGQMGVSIQSTYISVADSHLKNGTSGLIINQGENNTISRSGMTQNRNNGTYLFSSFWNDFTDNEILGNGDFGIRLDSSENNTISGRDISGNGISCVHLSGSVNNTVSLLNITSCLHGIYSEFSENNVYSSNNISSNDYGIQLVSSSKNSTILQSNISNNFVGIAVNSSYPSHINNNSILGNVFYAISAPSLSLFYLDAEYNYFGTDNETQIAKLVTDHVDYTPLLPYRESNVTYIDNYTEWTTNQTLLGGFIVNETGCLNITGTQQNEVTVTFNSTHIQNYIQVNNATNLNNTVLQTGSGPFTLLFLDSSNGRIENSNFSNFMGIGIQSGEQRLSSDQGIYVLNGSFFQSAYGIVLHRANNTLIEESTVVSNKHFGLFLHSSKQVDIGSNNVSFNRHGFWVEESNQINITNNDFYLNTITALSFEELWPSTKVWLIRDYAEYNSVADNNFTLNSIGIHLGNVSRLNNMTTNNFTNNVDGVFISGNWYDGKHSIAQNEFYLNNNGVRIDESIYNKMSRNNFTDNSIGVFVQDSTPQFYPFSGITNQIENNSILNAAEGEKGIYLISSERNFLYNNTVNSTLGGVKGTDTWGMLLESSSLNVLSKNTLQSNEHGIRLDQSGDNNLTFNEMTDNFYNFGVTGSEIEHFVEEINASNLVNNSKIYYRVGVNGSTVPSSAGYVGLISCWNISVPNVTLHNNYQGILLVNTTYSTIRNAIVNWTYHGVYMFMSNNDTLTGNSSYRNIFENNAVGVRLHRTSHIAIEYSNFSHHNSESIYITGTPSDTSMWNNVSRVYAEYTPWNGFGIRLEYVKNSTISNSTLDHCGNGIYLDGGPQLMGAANTTVTVIFTNISNSYSNGVRMLRAKYNLFVNNSFHQNKVGIYIRYDAQLNTIYHNNYQGNKNNHDVDWRRPNTWDDDYPSGGNWWCGFQCNDTNDDDICDEEYPIVEPDNIDRYPLEFPASVGPRDE